MSVFSGGMKGFHHGQYIFRGHVRLYVVYGIENKSSSGGQGFEVAFPLFTNLLRPAAGQCVLGIDSPTPENDFLSEIFFKTCRFHSPGTDMHGIDDIYTHFDEIGKEIPDRSARVEKNERTGSPGFDESDKLRLSRPDKIPEKIRRDKLGFLGAEIVPSCENA